MYIWFMRIYTGLPWPVPQWVRGSRQACCEYHIYKYIHIYIYIFIYIHTYTLFICLEELVLWYVCMYTWTYILELVTGREIPTSIYACTCMCTRVCYMYVYTHTCTHIYTPNKAHSDASTCMHVCIIYIRFMCMYTGLPWPVLTIYIYTYTHTNTNLHTCICDLCACIQGYLDQYPNEYEDPIHEYTYTHIHIDIHIHIHTYINVHTRT